MVYINILASEILKIFDDSLAGNLLFCFLLQKYIDKHIYQ
jgi:hypothetical protein